MSSIRDIVGAFRQAFDRSPKHKDLIGIGYEQILVCKMITFNGIGFICVDHKEDYEEFIAMLKAMPTEKETALIEFEAAISESNPHDQSIMKYGSLCTCDDQFLCEHRRGWIIDFVKENFCQ